MAKYYQPKTRKLTMRQRQYFAMRGKQKRYQETIKGMAALSALGKPDPNKMP